MKTNKIYEEFLKYFRIEEIFSPGAVLKYGRFGDFFLLSRVDIRLLETMLYIRKKRDKKITINTWFWGGRFSQRGVRDTSTPMTAKRAENGDAWLSAHPLAMGFDFDVEGELAEETRSWLKSISKELPYPIRLERKYNGEQINWVHLDVCDDPRNPKFYEFDI